MDKEDVKILQTRARNFQIAGIIISIGVSMLISVIFNFYAYFYYISIPFIAISIFLTKKYKKEFVAAYKKVYVEEALKSTFSNLVYLPDSGIDPDAIKETGMMNLGDRYESNDYFRGMYKNIKVIQADVHIEELRTTTDSKGNTSTYYTTIFLGKWMIFDFNKTFTANIQVRNIGFSNHILVGDTYKKVNMEDVQFNKKHKIYAVNEHDAFYVLTPALMEKITNLENKIKGSIMLCFVNNELHVALQNWKDSFEHGIYKKINEERIVNELTNDIKVITNFVDELNLDNNLFRKEV